MTAEEQTFMDALVADPTDRTARLVYADWLDDRGRSNQAKYLRHVRDRKFVRFVRNRGHYGVLGVRLTIPEYLDFFVAYHRDNPAWGSLHIVLDDGNVDDRSVRFCFDTACDDRDTRGERLADILYAMSRTQRGKLPFVVYAAERGRDRRPAVG